MRSGDSRIVFTTPLIAARSTSAKKHAGGSCEGQTKPFVAAVQVLLLGHSNEAWYALTSMSASVTGF